MKPGNGAGFGGGQPSIRERDAVMGGRGDRLGLGVIGSTTVLRQILR